jgi:hypothetical protein
MPVDSKYTGAVLVEGRHCLMTDKTKLNFLGDVFLLDATWLANKKVPKIVKILANVSGYGPASFWIVSIGDILMGVVITSLLIYILWLTVYFLFLCLKALL